MCYSPDTHITILCAGGAMCYSPDTHITTRCGLSSPNLHPAGSCCDSTEEAARKSGEGAGACTRHCEFLNARTILLHSLYYFSLPNCLHSLAVLTTFERAVLPGLVSFLLVKSGHYAEG